MIHLQETKIRECWDKLQAELKGKTIELETWAIPPREGSFYARGVSDRVFIEGKSIKGIRTITFPEFEKLAKFYNDYVDGVSGVKQKMRGELGYNTPYILTLIHHSLEDTPVEQEEEPVVKKKAPPEIVHYRSRPRRF